MIRLTDEQWERIRDHFPEENIADGRPGRKPTPARCVLEAVLWILNTGAQWHMLPQSYPTPPDLTQDALERIVGANPPPMLLREGVVIPKLADADSSCVSPIRTSIAKTYVGPMGYGARAQAQTLANMSQYFRSLV